MKDDLSRRSFLRLSGASTAAVMLGTGGADSAIATAIKGKKATVTGRVFVENGGRGRSLAGVLVSDGLNIAVTDRRGEYTLPIDPSRRLTDMVFVSLPDGYEVPIDPASRTPLFFTRIDQLVKGETRRFELGVTKRPGGQKPAGEFIHLTDVHVNRGGNLAGNRERFRAQVNQLNALSNRPDFIMLSGDLMDAGTVEEFEAYQDAAKDSIDAVFTSVGNHDVTGGPANDYAQDVENFRSYQGPEWYSFEWRGHHVVVIDNYDAGDLSPVGEPDASRNEQQFKWLKADLEHIDRRRPLIVVAHVALNDPLTIPGTERYIKLLRKYDVRLALTGHTHRNDVDPNVFPGGLTVVTEPGASPQDGGPVGFRRIILRQDGSFSIPFKQFDVDRRVVVTHPADGTTVPAGKVPLHVSAYDTSTEIKSIAVLLDGRRWGDLEQDGVWTWADDSPERVGAGAHRLDVRVKDDAGREWSTSTTFTADDNAPGPAPVAGSDWPSFGGGMSHSGKAAEAVVPPLRLAWTYRSGGGAILNSSPVVVDGIAYIGLKDENGVAHNGVVAVDMWTGREKWRVRTDAAVDGTPCVIGGRVHFSSIRGTVHAVDAKRGTTLWERRYGIDPADNVQRWWAYACPIAANGLVYQSFGPQIVALDAISGAQRWSFSGGGANSYFGMPALSEDGRIVYFVSKGEGIWALDAMTGAQLWRKDPIDGLYRSTPAVSDGVLYARCGGMVVAVDGATGAEVRRYTGLGYTYNAESPAVADGELFSPGQNGRVMCFDVATGAAKWTFNAPPTVESTPVVSGATVYFGSHDGSLYGVDRVTGTLKWRHPIGSWVKSSPAVTGNAVLVGAYDGNLYCFTSDAA